MLLAVSYGTFVFFSTQFGSPCSGPSTPLARTVSHATSLYWGWLKGLPTGRSTGVICGNDLGRDTWTSIGHTGGLLAAAAFLVVVFSLIVGVLAATRRGSQLDITLRAFSYLAWAVPAFLLALILQSTYRWLGTYGFHAFALQGWPGSCVGPGGLFVPDCTRGGSSLHHALALLRHLVLPAFALAVAFVGVHSRYLRSALLVSLQQPYTTTARAKGLPERQVVLRHALRNSLATFTSALLLDFGAIFGAALAVDWVFRLNGVGALFLYEIATPIINPYAVQLLLTITAGLVLLAAFLSELAVVWLDPRARLL